ncbi:DNA-directed RNA polymerase, mitochondrial [Angomonas deanei]|uniref:DNA-directed RNA polymerase n=1 Tax=Angomonas deanei TaxID=59799 RepID=A0A7G2CKF4_9TRYP|nr:DNA-directed RNA polymerase, mitochondrial [Angomonas deanei]CAD2219875.1 DNA-dependent RNA polymerase, putative [Angomonas deanei]|eukprot:EPY28447.1 DNA-directed RNA polymerase, mitochondrial [Angomonas deanei]
MLCDDLYYCKTDVLRAFARTRGVSGGSKSDVVLRLIESASKEAHGVNNDLKLTKQLLGDVFGADVRTSGVKGSWSSQSLEASHIEMAVERHLKFEMMANSSKTLIVRRNAAESGKVLRKLCRTFQQDYDKLALHAVGSVFRHYKAEADAIVRELSVIDIVSPFSAFMVSTVRYGSSMNLLTRTEVNQRLQTQLELFTPVMEEEQNTNSNTNDDATLQVLMSLLDEVVTEVEERESSFGEKKTQWGVDSAEVLVQAASHFAKVSHVGWSTEKVPRWVEDMGRMFNNWELVVRSDIPSYADVPRYVFDCILNGVVCHYVLQRVYGKELITPNDIPLAMRMSIRKSLERHFGDPERAKNVLQELLVYVQSGEMQEVRGGVRGEFFASVYSQMSGALQDGPPSELLQERILVILKEVAATASRCTRSSGLMNMLVKVTEDMRFHIRFSRVFKKLNAVDRKTIRTRLSLNMIKTLTYFEKEFGIEPVSVKAVAFLVVQLVYMSLRPEGGRRPILERFCSVTGRDELSVVGLTATEATKVQDLRIAFPPQLSYKSWLSESDTKEKSVYSVLPSVAVKGSTNQAMIISQAPMMQALDVISRVPWRINKYMLHVQEAIVREGFGFGKIRPGFYPLHYTSLSRGDVQYPTDRARGELDYEADPDDDEEDGAGYNMLQRQEFDLQQGKDWKDLTELRSSRIHYLQALRQARSLVDFSHVYFPNSMDFRGRMYPLPGRLNHTGSDPFRGILEYAEPKPLGTVGLYWLKVHIANKIGMNKLSFDERAHYVDEHIEDVIQSAERPLSGDRWWQEASEPLQCLMACKELADALKCSQGVENFLSRVPVAVDGSYNGLQHYSAIGRDAFGAELVNLVPSERPADAYTGILKEMLKSIHADAERDHQVAQRCLGTGKGQDSNHIKRKTIKRPIMTQVYGVTGYGMSEQILDELIKQNRGHGLWTHTDMQEMASYLREKVLESLGVTFRETQNCRKWITDITEIIWSAQPAELRNAFCWTTPLGLVVRQPYKVKKKRCSSPRKATHASPGIASPPLAETTQRDCS